MADVDTTPAAHPLNDTPIAHLVAAHHVRLLDCAGRDLDELHREHHTHDHDTDHAAHDRRG